MSVELYKSAKLRDPDCDCLNSFTACIAFMRTRGGLVGGSKIASGEVKRVRQTRNTHI